MSCSNHSFKRNSNDIISFSEKSKEKSHVVNFIMFSIFCWYLLLLPYWMVEEPYRILKKKTIIIFYCLSKQIENATSVWYKKFVVKKLSDAHPNSNVMKCFLKTQNVHFSIKFAGNETILIVNSNLSIVCTLHSHFQSPPPLFPRAISWYLIKISCACMWTMHFILLLPFSLLVSLSFARVVNIMLTAYGFCW